MNILCDLKKKNYKETGKEMVQFGKQKSGIQFACVCVCVRLFCTASGSEIAPSEWDT